MFNRNKFKKLVEIKSNAKKEIAGLDIIEEDNNKHLDMQIKNYQLLAEMND